MISRRNAVKSVAAGFGTLFSLAASSKPSDAGRGLTTRFTRLVGCTIPIQQAGMGSASPPELAAAVSEAGGLGMVGTARPGINLQTLATLLRETRALTSRPFGVNFIAREGSLVAHSPGEAIGMAAEHARVVEFFYTEPNADFVALVHQRGALVSWQVGSRAEALKAAQVGCDLIVAQGIEAGGHVRGTVGTLDLLCDVVGAVPNIPILAAGGITTGRSMASAIAAGADGVRVGTRFVASEEAGVHRTYTEALIAAEAEDSMYTRTFYVGWPEAPHRVLRQAIDAANASHVEFVGARMGLDGVERKIPRFAAAVADKSTTGNVAAMSLYAGQGVGAIRSQMRARDIVQKMANEAESVLSRL